MNVPARLLRWLIGQYQGLRAGRPPTCRFVPSCSAYAAEAVETHGALVGSAYAVRRICRCRPLGAHGYDPVPLVREPLVREPSVGQPEARDQCST